MERSSQVRLPVVSISRRGADRIRAGHVWVYRSDVIETAGVQPGAMVLVQEQAAPFTKNHADKSARGTPIRLPPSVRSLRAGSAANAADKDARPTPIRLPPSARSLRAGSAANAADKNVRPTRSPRILGSAFYSSASEIAIRMISAKPVED